MPAPSIPALARLRHLVHLLSGVRPGYANANLMGDVEIIDHFVSRFEEYLTDPAGKNLERVLKLRERKRRSSPSIKRTDELAVEIDRRLTEHIGYGIWLDDRFLKCLAENGVTALFEEIGEEIAAERSDLLPKKRRSRRIPAAGAEKASDIDPAYLRKIWGERGNAAIRAYRAPILKEMFQQRTMLRTDKTPI